MLKIISIHKVYSIFHLKIIHTAAKNKKGIITTIGEVEAMLHDRVIAKMTTILVIIKKSFLY